MLVLYNKQQRFHVKLEDLNLKFSEALFPTLSLNSTISTLASHAAIVTQQNDHKVTLASNYHSGQKKIKQRSHTNDSDEESNFEDDEIENPRHFKLTSTISHIFNKSSPFYGMLYRNEYGSALKSRIGTQAESYKRWKSERELWKSYFPNLMENFQKLEKFNPTLNKSLSTRSASVSFNRSSYKFGEEFLATITSRDREQRPKEFGGDYYRARLVQQNSTMSFNGIPCKVVDNCDGTYKVTAPLLLKGPMILEVKLVNSVEAIRYIVMKTENLVTWRMRVLANLESDEFVICNMLLSDM